MEKNIFNRYVRCSFISDENIGSGKASPATDVYFLNISELGDRFTLPEDLINPEDRTRTDKLQNPEYRSLILTGYTLLRSVLASVTGCKTEEIIFDREAGGKPFIRNSPVCFNIAHTRKSFAFAVSRNFSNGIDLEEMNRRIRFEPIIQRFFSSREAEYILREKRKSAERFILLWTRKESLLKLIGSGLTEDLTQVEVYNQVNRIDKQYYSGLREYDVPDNCFVYTGKLSDTYISVAFPCKVRINFHHADAKMFSEGNRNGF